tara:strand:- start:2252 stop:3007 length:756 start_codon:yes stop_codon:yes gene_type:complete
MESILLFQQNNFSTDVWWKLKNNTNGYKSSSGYDLVTEIAKGRIFRIAEKNLFSSKLLNQKRLLVQLFEDGYICWVNIETLMIEECDLNKNTKISHNPISIQARVPAILKWIQTQSKEPNEYMWGGTIGPNYDCSGLIQAAFFHNHIYIPRDSYQMKGFCQHLFYFPTNNIELKMGDLLFFGNRLKCNHVAIYFEKGNYFHSSGKEYGRNCIALDNIYTSNLYDPISEYYKSNLISAGRVVRSYRWDKTIR